MTGLICEISVICGFVHIESRISLYSLEVVMNNQDWQALANETHDIWDQNAAFWDDFMREGNDFQRLLIGPTVERLLELQPGQRVLDVACGNGNFARRLTALGAQVKACDFSQTFIERAKAHAGAEQIDYRVVDGTERQQLLALGEGQYNAVVCNMALMDMPDIAPLLQSVPRLLKQGGRFIFSVSHPCFNSVGITKAVEEEDREGDLITRYIVKVLGYITPVARKGLGVIGQPAPQYYFHRPLNMLFNACFDAGLVLDRLEEPSFDTTANPNRPFAWANYTEIPPVLIARLRMSG
jgi:2-polyprenyl-3-methyl-5-hydroxy-6-metoxy-1,4-benzoquinol methylase